MMEKREGEQQEAAPVMSLSMSFLPYIILTAVTLSVLLIPPSLNGKRCTLRNFGWDCHSRRWKPASAFKTPP